MSLITLARELRPFLRAFGAECAWTLRLVKAQCHGTVTSARAHRWRLSQPGDVPMYTIWLRPWILVRALRIDLANYRLAKQAAHDARNEARQRSNEMRSVKGFALAVLAQANALWTRSANKLAEKLGAPLANAGTRVAETVKAAATQGAPDMAQAAATRIHQAATQRASRVHDAVSSAQQGAMQHARAVESRLGVEAAQVAFSRTFAQGKETTSAVAQSIQTAAMGAATSMETLKSSSATLQTAAGMAKTQLTQMVTHTAVASLGIVPGALEGAHNAYALGSSLVKDSISAGAANADSAKDSEAVDKATVGSASATLQTAADLVKGQLTTAAVHSTTSLGIDSGAMHNAKNALALGKSMVQDASSKASDGATALASELADRKAKGLDDVKDAVSRGTAFVSSAATVETLKDAADKAKAMGEPVKAHVKSAAAAVAAHVGLIDKFFQSYESGKMEGARQATEFLDKMEKDPNQALAQLTSAAAAAKTELGKAGDAIKQASKSTGDKR